MLKRERENDSESDHDEDDKRGKRQRVRRDERERAPFKISDFDVDQATSSMSAPGEQPTSLLSLLKQVLRYLQYKEDVRAALERFRRAASDLDNQKSGADCQRPPHIRRTSLSKSGNGAMPLLRENSLLASNSRLDLMPAIAAERKFDELTALAFDIVRDYKCVEVLSVERSQLEHAILQHVCDETPSGVLWQYKALGDDGDDDLHSDSLSSSSSDADKLHGPYSTRQMIEWAQQGYFSDRNAQLVRRYVEHDDNDNDDAAPLMSPSLESLSSACNEWQRSDVIDFESFLSTSERAADFSSFGSEKPAPSPISSPKTQEE
jgi:GYF domain